MSRPFRLCHCILLILLLSPHARALLPPPHCFWSETTEATARLLSRQDQEGNAFTYGYGLGDNLTSETDAKGNSAVSRYDALNRRIEAQKRGRTQKQLFEYTSLGGLTKSTDENGNTTRQLYDGFHRPITAIDGNGNLTTTTYDANGNVASITDPTVDGASRVRSFEYDILNRQRFERDMLGKVTEHQYDANGNLIKIIDANLNETTYDYDAINR